MLKCNIVYDNEKDRKLLELIPNKLPILVNFIDFNTVTGRKEAYRIKSHWGAKANPFIEVLNDNKVIRCFYSEDSSAITQFIDFLNAG